MTSRKNHHFVPQFYFHFFSGDENCINVLHRATGRVHTNAPIKGQACKKLFYGSDTIESALGIMESAAATALKRLIELQNPMLADHEQIELVLAWIALQRARTQAARQADQPAQDKMLRLWLEVQINNDETLDDEKARELRDSLNGITSDPIRNQAMRMKVAMEMAGAMDDLSLIMLVNKTNRPFLFGDAPVVFYNAYYRNVIDRGVLGMDTPGLMVFFPVGPKVTLVLVDSARYTVKGVRNHQIMLRDLRDVAALNRLQIHAASTCVYFQDEKMGRYVIHLWEEERKSLNDHSGKVVQAPGFDADTGEALGDILHTFEPQLPYRLRLSFLGCQAAEARHYQISRRSERY
jgi:predicted thioredoxin/glutaredoxin